MSDFWSRALGGLTGPRPAPVHIPDFPWLGPGPVTPPAPPQASPKAQSSASPQSCPSCGSGNFFKSPQHLNAGPRCYDCGYPVQHSTSGMTLPSSSQSTPSRQTAESKTSNYRPGEIIGRL